MKNGFLLLVSISMMVNLGLYAQEEEKAQEEPLSVQQQTGKVDSVQKDEAFSNGVKLELVWEKEFEEGIVDVVLYEENLMPKVIISGDDPQWGCKGIYFLDKDGNEIYSRKLMGVVFDKFGKIINPWAEGGVASAVISKNGKYVGILEPRKFTEKEGNPIGDVEIIDSSGTILNRFPLDSWHYWVSPYGDEIVSAYPIMDIPIFSIWNKQGKKTVDLSKTSDPEYSFGNSLKVIGWRGAKAVENLVAVYDSTLKSHYKSFAIPATSNGYTHSNYFLLILPKGNKFALSTRSEFIKLYNENGKLVESVEYPVGGRAIFSSPNNRYLHIRLRRTGILYDIELGKEIVNTNISTSHAIATNNGKLLLLKADSLYFVSQEEIIGSKLNNLRTKKDEETIFMKTNPTGDKLCIITNLRIVVLDISDTGRTK